MSFLSRCNARAYVLWSKKSLLLEKPLRASGDDVTEANGNQATEEDENTRRVVPFHGGGGEADGGQPHHVV